MIQAQDFISSPKTYIKPIKLITLHSRGKKECRYYQLYCGFDIETYTIPESHKAYMYVWQFSIYGNENYVIIGRTWSEFHRLIDCLKKVLNLNSKRRIIIGVANLGYEFQFIRKQFRWSKIFAKEIRQPIYAIMDNCIEFRDILQITGGSLVQLSKDYTVTQKLSGDLDYTIPRNSQTPLTNDELQYCINDVAIVSEFMEYLFTTYIIPHKFIPLTKTGLLRREVKKGCSYNAKLEIYRCYPSDYNLYHNLMLWCFRGGYTHGNILFMDKKIKGLSGWDITSSYPYTMLAYDGFPVSPLLKEDPAEFNSRINTHCCIIHAIFHDLKAKTPHAIESLSKCLSVSANKIIDNGRIRKADFIEVYITDLDYKIYDLYYDFSSVEILELYTSIKGRLPRYLLKPLWIAYEKKATLKKEGKSGTQEYTLAKSYINSAYGMCVTRLTEYEVILDNENNWDTVYSFDYEKEKSKAFLLPQWGIYISAYSRYRLLTTLYKIQKNGTYQGIYCDTDSIKYVGNYDHIFEKDNEQTQQIMKKVCADYNLDYNLFNDLGSWEKEYSGVMGKFLGAKRYIITNEKGVTSTTIAGLPKKALIEYCEKYNKNIYDVFSHNMIMNVEVAFKNASCYNDEPHTDIIEGVRMNELSSVGIYPIEFTMKLDDFYMKQILQFKERYTNYEDRIL